MEKVGKSFRLLMEYHSFLYDVLNEKFNIDITFPSPYGVSFILIMYVLMVIYGYIHSMFPSPYGVSFILIQGH